MERLPPSLVHNPSPDGRDGGSVFWRRFRWLFAAQSGCCNLFVPRWIFLRALAAIYFSAFISLLFQIEGLIGPRGILPAQTYLAAVQAQVGPLRFWYAPTLFWLSSSSHTMMAVTWIG